MTETTEIKRRIMARLETMGLRDEKENIVWNFTSARTSSLSAMTDEELLSLLEKIGGHPSMGDSLAWGKFDHKNRQHSYLLSMCIQLGWTVFSQKHQRHVADIARLGRWIQNFAGVKKPLLQQDPTELQRTVYQFEQMVQKHFTNGKRT